MAMPEGMLRPSMTVVILSNLPSPLVLSKTLTRSLPGPAAFLGYSIDSVIQMRPRSSKVMATGLTMSGSAATSSTRKPSGTTIFLSASAGDRAGPGILSWPYGIGSLFCCAGEVGAKATREMNPAARRSRAAWRFIGEDSWGRGGRVKDILQRSEVIGQRSEVKGAKGAKGAK